MKTNAPSVISANTNYNQQEVNDFIRAVFGGASPVVAVCPAGKAPYYPLSSLDEFDKKLRRGRKALTCYFGTASMVATEGKVYNRQTDFAALHVLVLDDIGSKCPVDKVPEALREPSYIIESSEGNYQYGYVLTEPLTDLDEAKALVEDMYDGGEWDSGGKMPNKYVRLPCGYHKSGFEVRLVSQTERTFTPAELLAAADIKPDTKRKRAIHRRAAGNAIYNYEGVVDPVVEFLAAEGELHSDTGEWLGIKCPWAHDHSDPDQDTAGYSPLGVGASPESRGFNCFHGHCEGHNTQDFLAAITARTGEVYQRREPAALLLRDYVFERTAGRVINITTGRTQSTAVFKAEHARSAFRLKKDGTPSQYSIGEAWLQNPNRLVVDGYAKMPDKEGVFVPLRDGLFLNTYRAPIRHYIEGVTVDDPRIAPFLDLVEFLIPDDEEYQYFINWLASGVQNPCFRGNCILMVTATMGTGRGTLSKLIEIIHDPRNCAEKKFEDLNGQWDDWKEKRFVTVSEVSSDPKKVWSIMEGLKVAIDPAPVWLQANIKGGAQRDVFCVTQMLMHSNNPDAIGKLKGDRRIYVISNPVEVMPPAFYTAIREWLAAPDEWLDALYSWLMDVDVSEWAGEAPAPMTEGKARMMELTEGLAEKAVEGVLAAWPCDIYPFGAIRDAARSIILKVSDDGSEHHKTLAAAERILNGQLVTFPDNQLKVGETKMRLRIKYGKKVPVELQRERKLVRKALGTLPALVNALVEELRE